MVFQLFQNWKVPSSVLGKRENPREKDEILFRFVFLKMFHLSKYISTWNRFSCTKFNSFPAHGLQYCFRNT